MTTITIDELDPKLREIIERLETMGEPVAITRDGVPVAEITPAPHAGSVAADSRQEQAWSDEQWDAYWARWDRIGAEISKTWPDGVSAVDAVREQRREL